MAAASRDFGGYYLERRLGVGGMAETFQATRVGPGGFAQRVCLKRVLPAFSEDDDFVRQFHREARLAAQLRHTNIVGVIDFGEVEGTDFMALELVDGVDLRSLLASHDGRLPAAWVVLIALDLCHALEHAHQPAQAVVHRDISPSNVLVSRTGEVKLADFGIAKSMATAAATVSNTLKGKIPYMSPEHMRGEKIDGRADLFSLGVVLFEVASGVRPFDGAHDVETMQRILAGERQSLESLAPELPTGLRDVIERLIEVEREARFPDATTLIEELAEMAAPPQARRRLAQHIENLRGGPETRTHVQARREDHDTDLTTSAPPRQAHTAERRERAQEEATTETAPDQSPPPSRARRNLRLGAGLVLSVALVATVAGLQARAPTPASPSDRATEPKSATKPTTSAKPMGSADPESSTVSGTSSEARASAAPGATAPSRITDRGTTARPREARATAASTPAVEGRPKDLPPTRGLLQIVVEPWGNVWIDKKWMGRAPLERWVKPGRHVVQAGHDAPMSTQTIEVNAGAKKRVEMRLEP